MNRYELTYIIDVSLEETARKELIEKFSELIRQNGGEIEKVDETWGKRRLAYAINDMWEGWYVLVTFKASGEMNKEIERNLKINDKVLRYLIIKLLEKKQSVKPRPIRPVAVPVAPVAPAAATPVVTAEAPKPEVKAAEAAPAAAVEAPKAEAAPEAKKETETPAE